MAGETIKIASKDGGEFSAYLSKPDSGTGPGIVMVQEIFGLTPWLKKTADMFAGQGYVVVVPDLFWRFEKDFIADPENPDEFKKGIVYRDEERGECRLVSSPTGSDRRRGPLSTALLHSTPI